MKIRPEIEIFDDPECCSISGTLTGPSDKCGYGSLSLCRAFVDREFSPIAREYDHTYHAYKKCDQCKADYLKAKKEEQVDRIIINGYRYKCLKSRIYIERKIITTLICNDEDHLMFAETLSSLNELHPITTHNGLFNYIGRVKVVGMLTDGEIVQIEIMIKIRN